MALVGLMMINATPIVKYTISRREHYTGKPPDDSVNHYDWVVSRLDHMEVFSAEGLIKHRYGDGAELLLSKVLAIAGPQLQAKEDAHGAQ